MEHKNIWSQIPLEKKESLWKASIEEFSVHGFQKASTNRIIKQAGISKGLLFHYFGNKKTLYLSILDLIIDQFLQYFYQSRVIETEDFFQRIAEWSKLKIQLFFDRPLEYKIIMDSFLDMPDEISEELFVRYEKFSEEAMSNFLKDIDYTRFRSDFNPLKAIELIMVALEGLSNKYIKIFKKEKRLQPNELLNALEEIDEYLTMLKTGLYPSK